MVRETADVQELVTKLSAAQDLFRKYVVPIFVDNERGQPEVFGSALVVGAGRHVFLVSAAHVFDPIAAGRQMYIHSGPATKRWLGGKLKRTPIPAGRTRKADLVDIAVFKLGEESLPPYPEVNCQPMPSEIVKCCCRERLRVPGSIF